MTRPEKEFLKKPHDKPFLLVASFINPHDICFFEDVKAGKTTPDQPKKPQKPNKVTKPGADGDEGEGFDARAGANVTAALKRPDGVTDEEFFAKYCPPLPSNAVMQEDAPAFFPCFLSVMLALRNTNGSRGGSLSARRDGWSRIHSLKSASNVHLA